MRGADESGLVGIEQFALDGVGNGYRCHSSLEVGRLVQLHLVDEVVPAECKDIAVM